MWDGASRGSAMLALSIQCRRKGYHFYVNLDDPEETQRHVLEEKARLEQEGRSGTTAYLHQELNEVLALYQAKNYIEAHRKAEALHGKAVQHGSSTSLLFFTAKTAAHTCEALSDAYERHLEEKERRARLPSSLAPSPSVVFQAQRVIAKLRADAERYRAMAQRIQNQPAMAFLRSVHERKKKAEETTRSTSSTSSSNHREKYEEPEKEAGEHHTAANPSGRPCCWEEAENTVDADYETFFGARYRERRKRSTYQEQKHHLSRQSRRHVPK